MNPSRTRLSICIPTFNRAELLRRTLTIVCPQLQSGCELVIIDNASTDDTPRVVSDFKASFNKQTITYIRNTANIGGNSNVLRCFEAANAEWLWILGDDDFPMTNATATILKTVPDTGDVSYINFQSNISDRQSCARVRDEICTDIRSFLRTLDDFSNLLFISTGVYHVSTFRKNLTSGYQNVHTYAPHVAMMLAGLVSGSHGKYIFSIARIVDWERNTRSDQWDGWTVNNGIQYLTQLVPNLELRKNLSDKIQKVHAGMAVASVDVFKDQDADFDWLKFQDALAPIAILEATQQRFYSLTFKLGIKIFLLKHPLLAKILGKLRFARGRRAA